MSGTRDLDDDQTILVLIGIFAGPALLGTGLATLTAKVPGVAGWLIDHHILVAAAAQPIVTIPASGGAGLDWSRLIALTAAVLIWLTWVIWAAHTRHVQRRDEAGSRP